MTSHGINPIKKIKFTARFDRQYKKLSLDIKKDVDTALKDLTADPIPKKLRFEKLSGHRNPGIYSVHVTANHSHKMTFTIENGVASLREIATHKQIDKRP